MLENIPKEAEQLGLVGGVIGGAWLVFRAFVKKNITEKAEVNIYELQSKEIERLSVLVTGNQATIQLMHEKIMKIEVAQSQEAILCAGRIRELEQKLDTLDHQALLQAQIDQAGRDGKIDRRNTQSTTESR
jgi:hypothetical protein